MMARGESGDGFSLCLALHGHTVYTRHTPHATRHTQEQNARPLRVVVTTYLGFQTLVLYSNVDGGRDEQRHVCTVAVLTKSTTD